MHVVESYRNSTWLLLGGVLVLLLLLFLVWMFWYCWSSSRIETTQETFTVYADKPAHIKPCNGYVQRLAFCAKEATTVTVSINVHNHTQPLVETLTLTPDTVYWWQLTLSEFTNFSSVTISSSSGCVQVIAEVVSTNLCECKKKCDSACESGCPTKKKCVSSCDTPCSKKHHGKKHHGKKHHGKKHHKKYGKDDSDSDC